MIDVISPPHCAAVAYGAAWETMFDAVTKEVLRRLGSGAARMVRFELDGTATLLANEGTFGPHVKVGQVWENYPPAGLTATAPLLPTSPDRPSIGT
jgi:hypothetical protein